MATSLSCSARRAGFSFVAIVMHSELGTFRGCPRQSLVCQTDSMKSQTTVRIKVWMQHQHLL